MGYEGWLEREIIYLSLHCHHHNDFCIKMGSDESHFNVSVGSHKTVPTNHNLFEDKVLPLGVAIQLGFKELFQSC